MKQLKLVSSTNNILNKNSQEVSNISGESLQDLIKGMLELSGATQIEKGGKRTMVGLAAPQVGVSKRVILVDTMPDGRNPTKKHNFVVAINPKITAKSKSYTRGREGCFSTGRVCGAVSRPSWVEVKYYNELGNRQQQKYIGFTARIWQHEIDHLNGIRFPQRIRKSKYLHWVELDELADYRKNWRTWSTDCSFSKWRQIADI